MSARGPKIKRTFGLYPMTLMAAAQMIAHRDERAAAVGLPA